MSFSLFPWCFLTSASNWFKLFSVSLNLYVSILSIHITFDIVKHLLLASIVIWPRQKVDESGWKCVDGAACISDPSFRFVRIIWTKLSQLPKHQPNIICVKTHLFFPHFVAIVSLFVCLLVCLSVSLSAHQSVFNCFVCFKFVTLQSILFVGWLLTLC